MSGVDWLAIGIALVAFVIAVSSFVAAHRWRAIARSRDEMHARARAILAASPERPTVFDFVAPIRKRTAIEILYGLDAVREPEREGER